MIEKPAITSVPIAEPMASRWSGRAFVADAPVTQEQLTALLEAARWAPSCFGDQPWRYIVWDRFADEAEWQKGFSLLNEGNQAWVKDAAILMLAVGDTQFMRNAKPNRWGQHDTGAASMSICLQAASMGLMAHQMGGYDRERARVELGIPERFVLMSMIAVGTPAPQETLTGAILERELEPRQRAPLGERFFLNGWEKPFR